VKFSYDVGPFLCSGDIADLALGTLRTAGRQVLIKTARDERDRDLMYQEFKALGFLYAHLNETYRQCIPQVFDHDNHSGTNYLETFPGFLSAKDIHHLDPNLHIRTIVWMWKRMLGLLGWVHSLGWVHGAILPPHVLFYPDNNMRGGRDPRKHALRLVDWCYAVEYERQDLLSAWVPEYTDFYPPEVRSKHHLGPWTDIYMAAKVAIYLFGSDWESAPEFSGALSNVLRGSLTSSYRDRYQKAGDAFQDLKKAAEVTFGEPKFHRFILPL
jgi:hypothetical protein